MFERNGFLIFLLGILVFGSALGYEVETHQWITGQALARSRVEIDSRLLTSWGLESGYQTRSDNRTLTSLRQILILGAKNEDEFPRSLNHFFDPQHGGRPLSVPNALGEASPSWAIEDKEDYLKQIYSIRNANVYFYRALTGQTDTQRGAEFGRLFESIGRVVHHVQDMSQPEHVRNDQHLKLATIGDFAIPPFWASSYERYTLQQTLGVPRLPGDAYGPNGLVDLRVFDTARKFWTDDGRGIAEFTSNNFVSADTNFLERTAGGIGAAEFANPSAVACPGQALVRDEPSVNFPGVTYFGSVKFLATPIVDKYLPREACNLRTSTESLFSSASWGATFRRVYTLNRYNFDAAHSYLIPRAISYSAGLIDYFFRGRLSVERFAITGDRANIVVRNKSEADFILADSVDSAQLSEFEVWYDATDKKRKLADTLGGNLSGATVGVDQIREIQFRVPSDVDTSAPRPYMLVFRGKIGNEEGVIGQSFGSDGAVVIHPSVTPPDGIQGARVLQKAGNGWEFSRLTGAVAGNVDWRGRNGDVVTWDGPQSRYFLSDAQRNGVSRNVYMGGAIVAVAPANVLGAAARRTVNGLEVVAATIESGSLAVYARRIDVPAANNESFDPARNPYGWRLLGKTEVESVDSPVFFNASANEAQFFSDSFKWRHKLSLGSGSVSHSSTSARGHGTRSITFTWSAGDVYDEFEGILNWAGGSSYSKQEESVKWAEPTVVCADYRMDTEVLCQITADPARVSEGGETTTYKFMKGGSESGEGSMTSSTRRILSAGQLQIVLAGSKVSSNGKESETYDIPGKSYSKNAESRTLREEWTTRILYLDVRNDIAAYSTMVDTSDLGGVSYSAGGMFSVQTDLVEKKSRISQFVLESGGARSMLASRSQDRGTVNSSYSNLESFQTSMLLGGGASHYGTPPGSSVDTYTNAIEDSDFSFRPYIHPNAWGDTVEGFAVLADKTLIGSMEILLEQPDGFIRSEGTWSSIPGGDPSVLMPAVEGSSGAFYPLGLIR